MSRDERRKLVRVEVPSSSVEEECPAAKEGFDKIFYDGELETGVQ